MWPTSWVYFERFANKFLILNYLLDLLMPPPRLSAKQPNELYAAHINRCSDFVVF